MIDFSLKCSHFLFWIYYIGARETF